MIGSFFQSKFVPIFNKVPALEQSATLAAGGGYLRMIDVPTFIPAFILAINVDTKDIMFTVRGSTQISE